MLNTSYGNFENWKKVYNYMLLNGLHFITVDGKSYMLEDVKINAGLAVFTKLKMYLDSEDIDNVVATIKSKKFSNCINCKYFFDFDNNNCVNCVNESKFEKEVK